MRPTPPTCSWMRAAPLGLSSELGTAETFLRRPDDGGDETERVWYRFGGGRSPKSLTEQTLNQKINDLLSTLAQGDEVGAAVTRLTALSLTPRFDAGPSVPIVVSSMGPSSGARLKKEGTDPASFRDRPRAASHALGNALDPSLTGRRALSTLMPSAARARSLTRSTLLFQPLDPLSPGGVEL